MIRAGTLGARILRAEILRAEILRAEILRARILRAGILAVATVAAACCATAALTAATAALTAATGMLSVAAAAPAPAAVESYALLLGNNTGDRDEPRLRYAEQDAQRVYDVLRELGGFRPENMLLLRDEDAATARRALISLNDRIRTQTATGGQAKLIVYYSGHADEAALHLGRTALELTELQQLVRGSSASLRMLIVDACRSGALTRQKGGAIEPAFAVALDQRIPSEGVVLWTASAASENAQESDALGGSFFTHYLVSGLLGAADDDSDGQVTLGEAYHHAYDHTLRATSRTLAGTQHPTFHHELGGHRDIVLTTLHRSGEPRSIVQLPDGKSYLLLRGGEDGPVIAEVGAHDRVRRLSVKPGRYFVRGRGRDFLLEGALDIQSGEQRAVREQDLDRIAYARLVRKGHDSLRSTSSVHAGYVVRSALWRDATACHGAFAGYALDLPVVTIAPRLTACRAAFDTAFLHNRSDELAGELRASHAWDTGAWALHVGIHLGGTVIRQRFRSEGVAPARTALAGQLGVLAGTTMELGRGYYSGIELDAMTYFFRDRALGEPVATTAFALRLQVLLLGMRW